MSKSSVVPNSLQPDGLYSSWNSPGQNTGVDSLSLLQGIFPTQGSNPGLPHCRSILDQLSHREAHGKWVWQVKKSAVTVALISRSYLSYPLDMSIFTPSSPEWSVGFIFWRIISCDIIHFHFPAPIALLLPQCLLGKIFSASSPADFL